ncbi:ABC transporter permease subunit [Roseomonas sp. NAR14]|uniref:ABC transporter permease subunit n=1 Tax=Roseomonas acroporae TaxID=2937791 RepID=A0A9X1YAR4_9PROT|nr:ABC transporter permease subunit [Roseomonas acroporae]MCK8786999.1 ABC transporter permease subunit [Roseomonas acroporae]
MSALPNPAAGPTAGRATGPARRALRGVLPPLLLLAAWQAASTGGLADPRLLPPLERVAAAAWTQLTAGNLRDSLLRDLGGFALGASAGLGLGLLLGLSPLAGRLLRPSFDALKGIAVFAWIPLIAIWFGFGEASKLAFIALAAFTPVVLNVDEGVRGVPAPLREVAAALAWTPWQRLTRLVLPAALPSILTGLQLGLIHAWLATVGAEYFLAKGSGLGGVLIEGRDRFDMAQVLLGVLLLGGVGYALNRLADLAARRLTRWRTA